MRKISLLVGMGIIIQILMSCMDDIGKEVPTEKQQQSVIDPEYLKGNVYPLSKAYQAMFPTTQSEELILERDWENMNSIYSYTGQKVDLPWARTTDSNIPFDIAWDIKKEDGWKLIYHSFRPSDEANTDRNYLMLYNQRTGILKVFYYKENIPQPNNTGIWEISFTTPHQLFNTTSEIAAPIGMSQTKYWGSTNIVQNDNKGFHPGWNCFQVMLTYDPSNDGERYIDIKSHNLNTAEIDLFGELQSYSEGTIITHGSANPLTGFAGDMATVLGQEAGKWIDDAITKGDIKTEEASTKSALLAGAAAAIIKFGINKIFSSLTASFSKPTTIRSDLQFTTKGTSKTTGTVKFNSTSPIVGLRTIFTKERVGNLGVWNLTETPTIYIHPLAAHHPNDTKSIYRLFGVERVKYNIIINPDLTPYIQSYWVTTDLLTDQGEEIPNPFPNFDYGILGKSNTSSLGTRYTKKKQLYKKLFYDDYRADINAPDIERKYGKLLAGIFFDKEALYQDKKFDMRNHFIKVTLNLVTEFEGKRDTTISTRTFIPKIEWDEKSYNRWENAKLEEMPWISYPPGLFND